MVEVASAVSAWLARLGELATLRARQPVPEAKEVPGGGHYTGFNSMT
jgi:hypothetical protein